MQLRLWIVKAELLPLNLSPCSTTKTTLSFYLYLPSLTLLPSHQPSVQFSSVTQSCPTLWDPMDCSTWGFPFHHQLLEPTQAHVHWVGDAIQPSHPLLSPSPPAFNLSQHQGLFQWVSSLHQVGKASASVLPMNIRGWSPLGWTGWIFLQETLKSLLQHHSSKASILQSQLSL